MMGYGMDEDIEDWLESPVSWQEAAEAKKRAHQRAVEMAKMNQVMNTPGMWKQQRGPGYTPPTPGSKRQQKKGKGKPAISPALAKVRPRDDVIDYIMQMKEAKVQKDPWDD